jgi:hypothetical protein
MVQAMIELDEAQELLEPVKEDLISAHVAAVTTMAEFVTREAAMAIPLDERTRKNIMHCHIRSETEMRVADRPGVEPNDLLDFFALKIAPSILLRFKYVGHGGPSNVATKRQQLLAHQVYTDDDALALTGDKALRPPTLLTCGYTLDGAEIGRIEIRRDCKRHLPWSFDIFGGERLIQPLPIDGMADDVRPATVSSITKRHEKGITRIDQR